MADSRPLLAGISDPSLGSKEPIYSGFGGSAPSAPPYQSSDWDRPPAYSPSSPWQIQSQNIYSYDKKNQQNVAAPPHSDINWKSNREDILRSWGVQRENFLQRCPPCFMDQMLSGSGLYPPRMLDPEQWLLPEEKKIVSTLERVMDSTGQGHALAMDLLAPLLYDINVKIILDNSGSMSLDMFGNSSFNTWDQTPWISHRSSGPINYQFATTYTPPTPPIDPRHRRWYFAHDALVKWMKVFRTMGLDPPVYLLNLMFGKYRHDHADLDAIFQTKPGGSTPMADCIRRALDDHLMECKSKSKSLFLLIITDGEADNMQTFNNILDAIQNRKFGDVQVCLMGLSLRKEDIEWFENEECEDTRIRTIEPFEVEQYQMFRREVIKKEGQYTFDMHTYRALVTNFFPADYDYEAPIQNIRHRCYITCHGKDRWWGQVSCCYSCCSTLCGVLCCTPLYLLTCCCCCGYCQGNDCCKCRHTECIECCGRSCGGEES